MTVSYGKLTGGGQNTGNIVSYMCAPGNRADSYYSEDSELLMALIGNQRVRTELGFESPWFSDAKAFRSLLDGKHPVTGETIRKAGTVPIEKWDEATGRMVRIGSEPAMVVHDVTINHAPKSVSVLWALAGRDLRDKIEEAVLLSADMAVRELCREPLMRQRYGPGSADIRHVVNRDVVGAQILHTTARAASDDALPDPQLHVHNILIGALDLDGQLRALDSAAILRRQKLIDAHAQADLARRLTQLGLEIGRVTDKNGKVTWEISGVPASLCEAMSSRSAELEELRAEWEELRRELGTKVPAWDDWKLSQRRAKKKIDSGELVREWVAKARQHDFGPDQVEQLERRSLERGPLHPSKGVEAQLRREILDTLCREHALVPISDVRVVALDRARGLTSVETAYRVVEQMWADRDLLATADQRHVTTLHVAGNERRANASFRRLLAMRKQMPASEELIRGVIEEAEDEGRPFDPEQVAALRLATSGRRFVSICGDAGTGKGFTTAGMVKVWHALGRRTIAVAVAGRTAEQAQADSGTRMSDTVDGLLTWCTDQRLGLADTDVILVDEAGMLDHKRYAALLEAAARAGSTVVQVGDDKQLSPVGPGGLWTVAHSIAEEAGATAELKKVRRARDEREAEAWTNLREGRITTALSYWNAVGRLHLHDNRSELLAAMVESWRAGERQGCLLVDSSNAERDEINRLAQAARIEAGELGADSVNLGEGRRVHEGDELIFSEIHHAGTKIKNGTLATVIAVNSEVGTARLRLNEPRRLHAREVVVNASAPVELAYARHINKAQGMTADGAAVLAVGSMTNHNSLYTAVSRGRDGAEIHMQRSELPALTLPTLPPATEQQRAELRHLGCLAPEEWTSVEAATEIEYRTGKECGAAALGELKAAGLDQELAELIVLRVLHEQQEREQGSFSREELTPELSAEIPVELEHDILAKIRDSRLTRASEKASLQELSQLGERDGRKEAISERELGSEDHQQQQAAAARPEQELSAALEQNQERGSYLKAIHHVETSSEEPSQRKQERSHRVSEELEHSLEQEVEQQQTRERRQKVETY